MGKLMEAITAAACVAAAITMLSAPATKVTAGPRPQAETAPMRTCAARPWPYLGCVGTPFGNPHIRLVTSERFATR